MDCSEEDWEFGMRLNAFSPFLCIKYALPHMLKSVRCNRHPPAAWL